MDNELTVRKYRVKGRRTLADGTIKEYFCNKSYKVKNGVNDRRKEGNSGPKEKLTPAQKEEVWTKYSAGVTIRRICADIGVSYMPVKKCIDKKRAPTEPTMPAPIVPTTPAPITDEDVAELNNILIDI
jgi:hypothetical protein